MIYAFLKIKFWNNNQEDFCIWDRKERKKSYVDSINNFVDDGGRHVNQNFHCEYIKFETLMRPLLKWSSQVGGQM